MSSLAKLFRIVVFPALSRPSSRILISFASWDFSFLKKLIEKQLSSLQCIQTWGCRAVPSLSKKRSTDVCKIFLWNFRRIVRNQGRFVKSTKWRESDCSSRRSRYCLTASIMMKAGTHHWLSPFYNVISCKRQKLSQNSPPPSLIIWYVSKPCIS